MTPQELDAIENRTCFLSSDIAKDCHDLAAALRTAWAERDARPTPETVAKVREALHIIEMSVDGELPLDAIHEALRLLEAGGR